MSDARLDPPEPPEHYDFAPMPVEAVPPPPTVYEPPMGYDAPTGTALGYGSARLSARPSGLTAIGILSVTVGVMTLLASGAFGLWDLAMVGMSRAQRSFASRSMVVTTPIPVGTAPGMGAGAGTVAGAGAAMPLPASAPAAVAVTPGGLTPAEEQAVLGRIANLGARLNIPQRAALLKQLRTPGQQVVVPGAAGAAGPAMQVNSAVILADGSAMVQTRSGKSSSLLVVSRQGVVTQSRTFGWGAGGTFTTTTAAGTAVTGAPFGTRPLNGAAAAVAMLTAALNGALAVFLIVSGILVLRDQPQGRRLHLIYAAVKLPVSLAAAAATAWVWWSFVNMVSGMVPSPSGGGRAMGAATMLMVPALLGCVYPIVLLCVMESNSVREWYAEA